MVYRIFVEKKKEYAHEAQSLLHSARKLLGVKNLKDVRVVNRYDADDITEELFEDAIYTVFAEPQVDDATKELDVDGAKAFAVEFVPGQFDQRADSAMQCIQIISQKNRPTIRTAKVYLLYGDITDSDVEKIKKFVINPVEAREASFEIPNSLELEYDMPTEVESIEGFTEFSKEELANMIKELGLAMDQGDIEVCQEYFRKEGRKPTITEIKMIDTYWSDHCRHTTFNTIIDNVKFQDELIQRAYEDYLQKREELGITKPVTLMNLGTIAVKELKKKGKLDKLDESEEINACTVKIEVEVDGKKEPWLLLFKNETHNHPTEIEPFGGAATCIGGAIRDPLSGRSYAYGAMRITGAADPTVPIEDTIPGKLPQRKIVTEAAHGYSSYGNQIGLATGIVDEIYHPGYAAKRMEIGAIIAAAPQKNVRRERPNPGDIVILLGGRTGRDGIGGATGSSKAHDSHSVETCGAEVQKGNPPEERKIQRLFRREEASTLIKRCNDFGAGGVSVAIGELADGLKINLDVVPKKYEGLDGTELAISESQERMAVVVEEKDVDKFLKLAEEENLEATVVAVVTEEPRLVMNWNGKNIVDVSRAFLDSNGADKHIDVETPKIMDHRKKVSGGFKENFQNMASDLNSCSKRGLVETFDSTIGAGTVLMPFGGKYQKTPAQAMVQKISVEKGHTDDCSLMSWGYNPFITEKSQFHGAYLAVVESVCKLIACGAKFEDVYLSFQEYFEKLGKEPKRWGKPFSAVLGAYKAQSELEVAAIGGKDSMSGTFEDIHVPPTLVSFAVTTQKVDNIVSQEFKRKGDNVIFIPVEYNQDGIPKTNELKKNFDVVSDLLHSGKAVACYTIGIGGIAEAVYKMAIGNGFGFDFDNKALTVEELFGYNYGGFILEVTGDVKEGKVIGQITDKAQFTYGQEVVDSKEVAKLYEEKLEDVYHCNITPNPKTYKSFSYESKECASAPVKVAKPKVLIPAFPGTNCEFDTAKAMRDAGADPEIVVIKNLNAEAIHSSAEEFARKLKDAQMIFIPGGFSGGDEPDGSGKFITAFFRNALIKEGVTELLDNRGGLIAGICNGFQALVKLGLVPYGKIVDADVNAPTLTYNTIARHQSKIVRTKIASNKSPWLSSTHVGDIYSVPISHGEGRFVAPENLIKELGANGQIATQYVDLEGNPTSDVQFNPNDSMFAIEGITSPDGRVLGKMGHSERIGHGLYKNVIGDYDMKMFLSAVKYFK